MTTAKRHEFRPVTSDDLPLLTVWRAQPHVREWWGWDAPFDPDKLRDPRLSCWIVSADDRPFAYMQDYSVHGWEEHHFSSLPKGSRGIDQYIGLPEMIGLGHGTGFIRARMRELFDAGVPVIATDPHPENKRAISAYAKLGFQPSGPVEETRWGLILPMLARQ